MSAARDRLLGAVKVLGWKRWLLVGVNVILLLAMGASLLGLRYVTGAVSTVSAADRFRGEGDTRFAQLAVYLPVNGGKTEDDIRSFREALETKFVEQSLEAPENGTLYLDAYSGQAQVAVSTDYGSATVTATGVGGDFFYFHPLTLRSGSYFSQDDLMDDLVVLDEEMAWRLFGGEDLAGMSVTIGGKPFVVAGVVARETDFATEKAYGGDGGVYLSYSALSELVEDTTITSYEIVMPDPISGYALGVVKETFPVGAGDVVENSARYSLSNLKTVLTDYGQRSMRTNGVIYPYWENALRLTEDYAAALLLLAVLFAICPVVTAAVLVIRSIRRGYRYVKRRVPEKVEAAVEQHLEREYEKRGE